MTFTWLILDGLQQAGRAGCRAQEQQAYLETWLVVGQLMGIEPQLLPRTVADAASVTALIEKRQVAESPQGREMMAALLGMMQTNMPHPFQSMPGCLIREFLPPGRRDVPRRAVTSAEGRADSPGGRGAAAVAAVHRLRSEASRAGALVQHSLAAMDAARSNWTDSRRASRCRTRCKRTGRSRRPIAKRVSGTRSSSRSRNGVKPRHEDHEWERSARSHFFFAARFGGGLRL